MQNKNLYVRRDSVGVARILETLEELMGLLDQPPAQVSIVLTQVAARKHQEAVDHCLCFPKKKGNET